MAKVVSDSVNVGFQLRSIELLKGNLELPPQTNLKFDLVVYSLDFFDKKKLEQFFLTKILQLAGSREGQTGRENDRNEDI